MLERLKAGWEGDDRGWDGWMASLTRWTWVWVGSGRWWWTGKPGVLQSMGFPRVGHDWTEPKESTYKKTHNKSYHMCRNLEYTPFKVINLICMPTITISPQQCDGSSSQSSKKKKRIHGGLPLWHSGCETTCECRGYGFDPWLETIPHAAEQLSPCGTSTEPMFQRLPATTTEPTCHNYWSPHS